MSLETFELGSFRTVSGYTLNDAKLTYKTHGTLNDAKDNVIVFPHFLGAGPEALEGWIGEGRPLDPTKYFIILPGQFGNGTTTSPNNTPPPFDRGAFPAMKIADDVIAQHKLLTQQFGITEVQLILGWSTGALQTYEWAVRFAPMVKRMASIAGAPQPSPWTMLWLYTMLEEPIIRDPHFNGGFYADKDLLAGALRQLGHGTALTLPPPGFYSQLHETWRELGMASYHDFVSQFWEAYWLQQDPNCVVVQARKARAADPSEGGEMADALGKITAKAFVASFKGDPMFPPMDCKRDAERIPNAKFWEFESDFGHLATFALNDKDRENIDRVIQTALDTD